jgi:hypothetical protein
MKHCFENSCPNSIIRKINLGLLSFGNHTIKKKFHMQWTNAAPFGGKIY